MLCGDKVDQIRGTGKIIPIVWIEFDFKKMFGIMDMVIYWFLVCLYCLALFVF